MDKKRRSSRRELESRVRECGYKNVDDFFRKNPVTPFVVLAKEIGVAYQTISRHHKMWMRKGAV